MERFRLVYTTFPAPADTAGGFAVRVHEKGSITILINREKPEDVQRWMLKHELSHVLLGHLTDGRVKPNSFSYHNDNPEVEDEANQYADQMTDEEFSELMAYQIGETKYL